MTTNGVRSIRYEPDWARIPPHVTTYPNPPAYFRQTPAEKYTSLEGKESYQKWYSRYNHELPDYVDEHYRLHRKFPMMRRDDGFTLGVTHIPRGRPHITSDVPHFYTTYRPRDGTDTVSEATRARAINRVQSMRSSQGPQVYQYSNVMTSTQYDKPVPGLYGPMLRNEPYGLPELHNRHGFMPSRDFYF